MEWVRPFSGLAWGAIGWDRVYCEGMRDTDLFQLALGLQSPWTVTRSEFAVEDGRLDLYVDFPRGSRFACAECGREGCAVHDTKDETWRHLDFFQHRTLLHARVPRVSCPNCGVRKVATPWARAGSGASNRLGVSSERLGSSRRPRADEETGQDDHGQVGRHPQIDRHRPFQWRPGGDQ